MSNLLSPEEQAELQAAIAEAEAEQKPEDDAPADPPAAPPAEAKTEEPKPEAKTETPAKTEAAASEDDAPLPQLDEPEEPTKPVQHTQQLVVEGDIGKAQAEIDAITKYRTDLHKKFQEGEIETADYQAKLDEANDRMAELKAEIKTAELAAQTNVLNAQKLWHATAEDYCSQYKELHSKSGQAALNFHVKAMKDDKRVAEMVAEGQPDAKIYRFVLREAHKTMRAELGLGGKPAEVRDSAPPPKTLANLPQATPAKADADEFADIDMMTGEQAEAAIRRMPAEKRERYLMRE